MDHTPRELLLLSATGLKAGITLGSNPASSEPPAGWEVPHGHVLSLRFPFCMTLQRL